MGFLQLLVSLWPFLKEMFVGERIKVAVPVTEEATGQTKQLLIEDRRTRNKNIFTRCVDKMQDSKRFLAIVLLTLTLSLFINYKAISKLSTIVLPPRSEEKEKLKNEFSETPETKEPKEVPTVPLNNTSDRDVLFDQTVRELKHLYGESR